MFADLDVHVQSNKLAVLKSSSDGTQTILVFDWKTKKVISEIENTYIPQGPRLSPDGSELAFFSNDGLLFIHSLENKLTKVLFNKPGCHANFCEWSPDGSKLCFGSYENTPPNMYMVDVKDQVTIQLTDNTDDVDRFPQWAPNGQYIAFHRQNRYEIKKPKTIIVTNVNTRKSIGIPRAADATHEIGRFCWSKDSKYILFKETLENSSCLKIYSVKNPHQVLRYSFPDLIGGVFFPTGEEILVVCEKEFLVVSFPDGKILAKLPPPEQHSIQTTLRGPVVSVCPESKGIYFLNRNSCIYSMNFGGDYKLLLKDDPEIKPVFEGKEYEIASLDGRKIPVHCFIPENPKSIGILFLFGGPSGSIDPNHSVLLRLLNEGYEVIAPAYRGKSGYGKEHSNANIGEYGRADVWDVLAAGVDWKNKNQSRPLVLIGFSYGGFLTFLTLAQKDNPFKLGITLWGATQLEHMGLHEARAYPEDPEEKRIAQIERNPLKQAHKIKKPLLILHGGKDTTATNEDVQYIRDEIQSNGGTCKLVIFEDDTHSLAKHRDEMFDQIFTFMSEQS